jgi:adenosine/AMP kinase
MTLIHSPIGRMKSREAHPDRPLILSTSFVSIRGLIHVRADRGVTSNLDWSCVWRDDAATMETKIATVTIEKPEPLNFILGQTHFIKSVEDIHETLVAAVPGIKFGLAFCEASGQCLVRWSGTDPAMIELAKKNAQAIGAGHSFILFLGEGFYPINVLNALKLVPEVCRIFCATANPTQVVVAETGQGRGIMGVVDGLCPKGVEGDADIAWRKSFLRKIGYKVA